MTSDRTRPRPRLACVSATVWIGLEAPPGPMTETRRDILSTPCPPSGDPWTGEEAPALTSAQPPVDASSAGRRPEASERYLILADISGYTAFLSGVEQTHGLDFSAGIPAGYPIIAALLDAVVRGLQPTFTIAKIEGDAVFGITPVATLDALGDQLVAGLREVNAAFREAQRVQASSASDHVCTACPVAGNLWLKMFLHRGMGVQVAGGSHTELHGPAVTLVHRLLKNGVVTRTGPRPYLLVTDVAAERLGLIDTGLEHHEDHPDAGRVQGRIISLE